MLCNASDLYLPRGCAFDQTKPASCPEFDKAELVILLNDYKII